MKVTDRVTITYIWVDRSESTLECCAQGGFRSIHYRVRPSIKDAKTDTKQYRFKYLAQVIPGEGFPLVTLNLSFLSLLFVLKVNSGLAVTDSLLLHYFVRS